MTSRSRRGRRVRSSGHEKAKRCYAWIYPDGEETKTVAVLEIPPVTSLKSAVKVAIATKPRQ